MLATLLLAGIVAAPLGSASLFIPARQRTKTAGLLFSRKAAFLRTPKTGERFRWRDSLRANWAETVLALAGMAGIGAACC